MNWSNYLLENKSPISGFAHLGVLEGTIEEFDFEKLPKDAKIISISTPLKASKLKYMNWEALIGNESIEAITGVDFLDEERLKIFETLPNLKYLELSFMKQEEIPSLERLKHLEVLIISNLKKAERLDFLANHKSLKTLYIYNLKKFTDFSPIGTLSQLEELALYSDINEKNKKLDAPLAFLEGLENLKFLHILFQPQNKDFNISEILKMKKLEHLCLNDCYLTEENRALIKEKLPNLKELK